MNIEDLNRNIDDMEETYEVKNMPEAYDSNREIFTELQDEHNKLYDDKINIV